MITQEGKREVGELNIQLEKNTFKQGEKVQGTLKLTLNEKYNGEVIYLLFLGKIFTKTYRHQLNEQTQKWDDVNQKEESKSVICQRYELFSFKKNLTSEASNSIVTAEGEGDLMINPGQYQISFHFQLPDTLEYSSTACKGAYGISKDVSDHYDFHVKYFIEVFIPTKDTTCTPISDKFNITIIGNDVINRKKSDNQPLKKESSISSSSSCFCFSSDSYIIRTQTEKMCYQSQQKISVNLEIDGAGNSKQITKVTYEFKRILIFKSGYQCSKELKTGETSIKLVKQKTNEVFECKLPIALALSHHSNLVDLKYVVEFKFYSGKTLLDIHQHDFYLEPNVALDKWEEKNENDNNEEEESNEDAQVNILRANSNINWQKCKSTVDYYYTNLDHFRKVPTIVNPANAQ